MTFKDQLEADLDTFLSDFADDFTVGVGTTTIKGDLDNGRRMVNIETGEVYYEDPVLTLKTSNVTVQGIAKGTKLTDQTTGAVYKVVAPPRPDGTGLSILQLARFVE